LASFRDIFGKYQWREIRNCPGRYCAKDIPPNCTVSKLLEEPVTEQLQSSPRAKDFVIITPMEHGGIISFKRRDGSYLHTLNTPEGFARKRADLGL
jgi:hypothetical protein